MFNKERIEIRVCKCGCPASVYKGSGFFGKYRCGCMDSDCNYSILWYGDEYRTAKDAIKAWNESK